MARLSLGPAAAAAAAALTAWLAFDGGGFQPVAFDRVLVVLAALGAVLVLLDAGRRPGLPAAALLGALALLTAWTAASWLWSDSPPPALEEAQRVALYLAGAAAVVLAGRRVPPVWLAGGVAAGIVPVAAWNLAVRLAPDWTGRGPQRADIGSLAAPVGYANGLALLAGIGLLLALGLAVSSAALPLRAGAAALLVLLAADVALQQSAGADAAVAAGLVALLLVGPGSSAAAAAALLVVPLLGASALVQNETVVSPPPQDLTAAAGPGHRLLLLLVLLAALEAGIAFVLLPRLAHVGTGRVPARAAAAAAGLLLAAGLVAAPFALRGHERGGYWSVAIHELKANPVLGSGAGTFAGWWVRTRTTPHSTAEAHSLYLETLAELGPVGLLAILAALGVPLAAALRLRRTAWGPALLGALVAYAVHVAVDFDWELAGVTLPAVVLGATAAVQAASPGPPLGTRTRRLATVLLTAFTAAAILALAGSSRLASARAAEGAGRFDAAVADAHAALRYAPWSADAWRIIGESRRAAGDRAGARAAFRSAIALDRNEWQIWAELAEVSTGEPRRAAEAEAARLNPLGGGR